MSGFSTVESKEVSFNQNREIPQPAGRAVYEVMHGDRLVCRVDSSGRSEVLQQAYMPYDLYLEEAEDIDTLVNNVTNFYHWCAGRVLTLDRQYAKAILNSIGVAQATTDKDRARIALSYHCVSLTDIFWVRMSEEELQFADINLYDNHLGNALVDIALRGRQMTVTNEELARDLSTGGSFPKAWIREANGFRLLKDGGEDVVRRELLASRICQCFDFRQVRYRLYRYEGQRVTESDIITTKESSIVTKAAFDVYAQNHDMDTVAYCCELDAKTYYGMNILDYLVGNTDRHPENWGFLVENKTNRPISLYPIMDFNQAFLSYTHLQGANCQTVLPRKLTQLEAAREAVARVGLCQIKEVDLGWFEDWTQEAEMFEKRLEELRIAANITGGGDESQ